MARRQDGKLHAPAVEERVWDDEEGIRPLARQGREGRIDLADGAGVERPGFAARSRAPPFPRLASWTRCAQASVGLTSTATRAGRWDQLAQQSQPLRRQLGDEKIDAGRIAARPVEAGDQAELDGVVADAEHDRDRRGRRLGRERRRTCWSRRSRSPGGGPDRPPAPATDHSGLPPSGIRSPRSGPRRSRLHRGPAGTRASSVSQNLRHAVEEPRSPASPAAAPAPRAATPPRCRERLPIPAAVRW